MGVLEKAGFVLASFLSGLMRSCIDKVTIFTGTRKIFGEPINTYGTVQEKLARMAMLHYVTESMAYLVAALTEHDDEAYQLESAICKCFSIEAAWFVCNEAIQMMEGMGSLRNTGLELMLQNLRHLRMLQGTNDMSRVFIAISGFKHAGLPLNDIEDVLKDKIGYVAEGKSEKFWKLFGLGNWTTKYDEFIDEDLLEGKKLLLSMIKIFGLSVNYVLLKYNIKEEQLVISRIANAAFEVFSSSVVLSRASMSSKENVASAVHEKIMAQTWIYESNDRLLNGLKQIIGKKAVAKFKNLHQISSNVSIANGVVQKNPFNL